MANDPTFDFEARGGVLGPGDVNKGMAWLSEVDGFLTAVVIAPDVIMPGEWFTAIFGGRIPELGDKGLADAGLSMLMKHHNELLEQVQSGADAYEPVFWSAAAGRLVVDDWVRGFMEGYRLRAEQWAELIAHEDKKIMAPIFIHLRKEDGSYVLADIDDKLRQSAVEHIRSSVVAIDRFWRRRRKKAMRQVRAETKLGRNDPCICGSGRKYKKCCGVN